MCGGDAPMSLELFQINVHSEDILSTKSTTAHIHKSMLKLNETNSAICANCMAPIRIAKAFVDLR